MQLKVNDRVRITNADGHTDSTMTGLVGYIKCIAPPGRGLNYPIEVRYINRMGHESSVAVAESEIEIYRSEIFREVCDGN